MARPGRHALPARAGLLATALVALLAGLLAGPRAGAGAAPPAAAIPLIDAHSQVDFSQDMERIVALMDQAGVARTILAARGRVTPEALVAFAARHPGRITPAVRSKGNAYATNAPGYYKLLRRQLAMPGFGAMAEVLLWHAEKRNKAGRAIAAQVVVPPEDRRVQAALAGALRKGWPFVVHIEFGSAGPDRAAFMAGLEALLSAHPAHPFALIHMGQLGPGEVRRLCETHPNLHFLTAHTTPLSVRESREPWTNLFRGGRLAPEWRALVARYPVRFVLAFDNVWAAHWGRFYLEQAALWRKALAALPPDVAHALAHGNAERLWRLPPAR